MDGGSAENDRGNKGSEGFVGKLPYAVVIRPRIEDRRPGVQARLAKPIKQI